MYHRIARRHLAFLLASVLFVVLFFCLQSRLAPGSLGPSPQGAVQKEPSDTPEAGRWQNGSGRHPVLKYEGVPPPKQTLPRIQYDKFQREEGYKAEERRFRQEAVKKAFERSWAAYKQHAWMSDELRPVATGPKKSVTSWGATLVDALDTLWIMGLKTEFAEAVDAVATINFTTPVVDGSISVFEATATYLGGLVAAYDLSGDRRLVDKAIELADTLYGAFDTPNRMPVMHWNQQVYLDGGAQNADRDAFAADIGSLALEFTRLSLITADSKYYDATNRIMKVFEEHQNATDIPGMWPFTVNALQSDFTNGTEFSIGAKSHSLYEYLLKMVPLLGGSHMHENMYKFAADAIIENILFRPMLPHPVDVLMAGKVDTFKDEPKIFRPQPEHLDCFAGGMFALGGRLLENDTHVNIGRMLTDGCVWVYAASPLGIMPENFTMAACDSWNSCSWNESRYGNSVLEQNAVSKESKNKNSTTMVKDIVREQRLPPGFTSITNRNYGLGPEAIESVFVLYRISGNAFYQEVAWKMFENIYNATETSVANAALEDVTDPKAPKLDHMKSSWLSETLKYFYLVFSEPNLISLDDYVFSTQAHPFKRPKREFWGW